MKNKVFQSSAKACGTQTGNLSLMKNKVFQSSAKACGTQTGNLSLMKKNLFLHRKKSVFLKPDKSYKGRWDEKIIKLCRKINSNKNYYTTSSCSGRVVIMIDEKKKLPNLFLAVSHNIISLNWIIKILKKISKKEKNAKFKYEPPILHIVCRDLKYSSELLEKAKKAGFKHSGIHSIRKKIVVEINGSDRLEFPLINKGKILVNPDFLKTVANQSNEKLKKGWKSISLLEKSVK